MRGVNSQAAGLVRQQTLRTTRTEQAWRLASIIVIPSRHHKKRAADAKFSGCVFLPAAGNRNGTSVSNVSSNGNYWSSSPNGTNNAYNVNFNSGNLNPANNNNRNNGRSVRLVRQAERALILSSHRR